MLPTDQAFRTSLLRRLVALEDRATDLEGIEHDETVEIAVQDEGVGLGSVNGIDYVGGGVTVSMAAISEALINVPAGGGAGGDVTFLGEVEVSGAPAPSIDFNTISQAHRHLLFMVSGRTDVNLQVLVGPQFNGITTSDYVSGRAVYDATLGTGKSYTELRRQIIPLLSMTHLGVAADLFGHGFCLVPYYSDADRHKGAIGLSFSYDSTDFQNTRATASMGVGFHETLTAAITDVSWKHFQTTTDWEVGSKISMYGIS